MFQECRCAVSGFCRSEEGEYPPPLLTPAPHTPLVVKPCDNMGGRGCSRVESPGELDAAIADAAAFSRTGRAIVEEYMDGPEFSIDAIVYGGKVYECGFADRHIFYPPYFIEMGHTIPSAVDAETKNKLMACFEAGVHALGLTSGAAKGDIKLTSRGPMIGEIAARLSGGYMSGWTYPYSSGFEVTEAAIEIAMGLPPGFIDIGGGGGVKAGRARNGRLFRFRALSSGSKGWKTRKRRPVFKRCFRVSAPVRRWYFPGTTWKNAGMSSARPPCGKTRYRRQKRPSVRYISAFGRETRTPTGFLRSRLTRGFRRLLFTRMT